MPQPIVFISYNRIKDGMREEFSHHYQASISRTVSEKPGTFVQVAYVDEKNMEVAVIRVFPSAEALDLQLTGADDRSKTTYQYIQPTKIEIYGTPTDYAMEMMKKVAGSGIEVTIMPQYIGGFIRSASGNGDG